MILPTANMTSSFLPAHMTWLAAFSWLMPGLDPGIQYRNPVKGRSHLIAGSSPAMSRSV